MAFLRVRQRGRGGLRAFVPELQPVMEEIGIDRFSMTVIGNWIAEPATQDSLSVEEFFEMLTPWDEPQWFRMENTRTGVVIKSRSGAATTLGAIRLGVDGRRERGGFIKFALKGGNVTRTLHHLLIMHGHLGPQFAEFASQLDPVSFFMRAPGGVPLGFGEDADNWISDYAVMRACLGDDPFGTFHPIYVRQLQRMVGWLVLPLDTRRLIPDGTSMWSRVPGISCRMDWGDVRLQQIEAYFERRHSHAVGAVRLLATAALVDFDDAQVWRYITNTSLWAERADDNLSVGFDLRENYRLAVYAKAPGRIRFEVRRKGKGTTIQPSDGVPMPEARLLDMFRHDQSNLLDAAQWRSLGPLMDEHPAPQMSDLVHLCSAVQRASAAHEVNFSSLLAALLEDGGLKPNGALGWSDALISDLRQAGILYRPNVRRRDHRRPNKRHALRPEYRGLLNLVSRSLLNGHGLIAERA
ncbi:hypothetical protein J4558_00370 [Leptolyngbya sp. 15MV]|nr:hypothetical protein J4558_00370 [Leptolyngbya sp. 15MV]